MGSIAEKIFGACSECKGSGIHRDNDRLIEVVHNIIDKRLKMY